MSLRAREGNRSGAGAADINSAPEGLVVAGDEEAAKGCPTPREGEDLDRFKQSETLIILLRDYCP